MPYSLTRRQQHLYTDRSIVFVSGGRGVLVDQSTGKPIPNESSASVSEAYPCKYTLTENVDDPAKVGRIKRFELDTADWVHFPVGVSIKNGDYLANVTTLPDGTRHPNWGTVVKVLGAPQVITGAGRRPVNMLSVRIVDDEHPPAYIAAYLNALP